MAGLKDELGDLLLQVVFPFPHGGGDRSLRFRCVAEAIVAKMLRRHPHVFGSVNAATQGGGER